MAYADDITITSTHTITSAAKKYIQPYLPKVFVWTKHNNLSLNPDIIINFHKNWFTHRRFVNSQYVLIIPRSIEKRETIYIVFDPSYDIIIVELLNIFLLQFLQKKKEAESEERRRYPLEQRIKEEIIGQQAAINTVCSGAIDPFIQMSFWLEFTVHCMLQCF